MKPSNDGLTRIWRAWRNSLRGLQHALRHEAAFRQELTIGVPLIVLALFLAPGRWQRLALVASVALVWIVELLNSAIESLADRVSREQHPLIGQAKDMGSAAVMLSLLVTLFVWIAVFWS